MTATLALNAELYGLLYLCLLGVFKMVQVQFAFESERSNGNSVTKQSPNYHSSDLDKVGETVKWHLANRPTFLKWPNGNSATQTQMEPEAYRMHILGRIINVNVE